MVEQVVRLALGDRAPRARLLYGADVQSSLRSMAEESVHCVVTSPPYWGLRSYLSADDANKVHEIGSEETLDGFVERLTAVFRDVRRVLRSDGTLWLNLGDSYCGGGRAGKNPEYWERHTSFGQVDDLVSQGGFGLPSAIPEGLKPKDLAMVPFRVALALQEDGWWLRAVVPWVKKNVMPESCTDRPTTACEYWFMLAKSAAYYYDIDAVRKSHSHVQRRHTAPTTERKAGVSHHDVSGSVRSGKALSYAYGSHTTPAPAGNPGGRNRRTSDAWVESMDLLIAEQEAYLAHLLEVREGGLLASDDGEPLGIRTSTTPYRGSHFAVFPPKLIEPLILAGTSEHGCCPSCGAPWRRLVDHTPMEFKPSARQDDLRAMGTGSTATALRGTLLKPAEHRTVGWEPSCACEGNDASARPVVLDPFSGSATTGMVSLQNGRDYVGLDLNEKYLSLAEARILEHAPPSRDADPSGGDALDIFGDAT
jgi:DNA modification methylase